MKKIRITEKQASLLKKLKHINESEGEESGVKSVAVAMGDKVVRVVISGGNVPKIKDRIIQMVLRQDPQAKINFFDATGKIVGNVKDIKLDSIQRDLKMLDPTINVENKPISKSIKESFKKVKITQEQYNRIFTPKIIKEQVEIKGGHNRVDKAYKKDFQSLDVKNLGEDSFDIEKPNISVPKLPKEVGNREAPIHENADSFKHEISELIKFIYKKTESLSPYWEENGLTYDDICNKLLTNNILVDKGGVYELSKTLGTPEAAVNAVEETLKGIVKPKEVEQEIEEVGGYPAGAENDSNAPFNKPEPNLTVPKKVVNKQFEVIAYNPEIAILKNAKGELYVFDYYNLDKGELEPYAQIEKTFVGKDEEGQPDFDYGDFDVDADVIEAYVNDNIGKLTVGAGADDFESGVSIVKIDSGLKQELLNLFDKNKSIVKALSSIEEEIKPENILPILKKQLEPPINPVKKTPEAIKAALAKKKAEEMSRRKETGEIEEMTSAGSSATGGSSGPFVGPMNAPVIKRQMPETPVVSEMTSGTGSVGPYDANALPNIDRDGTFKKGKKTKAETKTQWAGGSFVELDNCTKLNNNKAAENGKCSTGAIDNVVKIKKTKGNINAPSLSENEIYGQIAKKTGKSIEAVKFIIESKISKTSNFQ